MSMIDVNVIMTYDKLKIVAVANINNELIMIHKESINIVSKAASVKKNIKSVINAIESKTQTKVEAVNIILDDFMKKSEHLKITTKILEETINYDLGRCLSQNDYEEILQTTTKKIWRENKENILVSIIPFKFVFVDSNSKMEYDSALFPVNKQVSRLKIQFSTRFIDKQVYLKAVEWFDALEIKINTITLESQLSIYDSQVSDLTKNRTNFALVIKNDKSMLVSSVNNVVIKTDVLNFSFEDLVVKLRNNFGISDQEVRDLINCYGNELNFDGTNEEVIYSSSLLNDDFSKSIRKSDIAAIVKSFLKSVCTQANGIIKSMLNNNLINNLDLVIIGKLSTNQEISNYCAKYFEKINVSFNKLERSIYSWDNIYQSVLHYSIFQKSLAAKTNVILSTNEIMKNDVARANSHNIDRQPSINKLSKDLLYII